MELILIGAIIGFVASWAVFRRENWRLEDKVAEKQEQIDDLLRQQIKQAVRDGDCECPKNHTNYFVPW